MRSLRNDVDRAARHLSRDEEVELFDLWRSTRDARIRCRVVVAHTWLVRGAARSYRCAPCDRGDLVAEGMVALLIAFERFDPTRGTRFSTYARPWVRAAISEYFLRCSNALHSLGRARRAARFRARMREVRRAAGGGGPEHIAEVSGLDATEVAALEAFYDAKDVSLDAPLDSAATHTLLDVLPGEAEDIDARLDAAQRREALRDAVDAAIATFDARERAVFEARLSDEPAPPLEDVASRLAISRERARQIEARVRAKLAARIDDAFESESMMVVGLRPR